MNTVALPRTISMAIVPWFMWSIGALFYAFEFLLQVSPSVMGPELMRDFDIDASKLGIFGSVYFWAYAALQLPGGVLLDKLGPHRLLGTAAFLCALGCILFSMVDSFALAMGARLFIGAGSAFAAIGCMKLAANWFPVNKFALLIGLMVAIGMSGAIMGEGPLANLVEAYTWRSCMLYLSIIGGLLSFIFFVFVRDYPKDGSDHKPTRHEGFQQILINLGKIIKNPQMWILALYGGLMFGPTITFAGQWGVPFMMEKLAIDKTSASYLVSLTFVGWVLGSPIFGFISDKLQLRKPPLILGSLLALVSMCFLVYLPYKSELLAAILMFLFGVCSSAFLPAFSIVREISPKKYSASALGFMNTMNTLGIALMQPVVGILLDQAWHGITAIDGIRVYLLSDYQFALAILPIGLAIALLLSFFIKETHCRYEEY